jgi:membrane-associated HD superfamily phosphohydrolase
MDLIKLYKKRRYIIKTVVLVLIIIIAGIFYINPTKEDGSVIINKDNISDKESDSKSIIGVGTNFTSLYAYYLASPANWIIVLFPQKYMIEIMNTLIILKLSLSSVSMTHYISRHFSNKNICIALFGLFYAFSGYVAAYSWNIMWLDCLIHSVK